MAVIPLSPSNPLLQPGSVYLVPGRTKSVHPGGRVSALRYRASRVVSPGILPPRDPAGQGRHPVLSYDDHLSGVHGQAGALCLIQRTSGCRIGEALRLTTCSIVLPDMLIIIASKGSISRSIRLPELQDQLTTLYTGKDHPLFSVSYSHVYRQYRNAGIIQYRLNNPYNRVTHSLRQSFIQAVQLATDDVSITKDIVGHKSKRSTLIYLKKGSYNG